MVFWFSFILQHEWIKLNSSHNLLCAFLFGSLKDLTRLMSYLLHLLLSICTVSPTSIGFLTWINVGFVKTVIEIILIQILLSRASQLTLLSVWELVSAAVESSQIKSSWIYRLGSVCTSELNSLRGLCCAHLQCMTDKFGNLGQQKKFC